MISDYVINIECQNDINDAETTLPDLSDPLVRALPVSTLALAFAIAHSRRQTTKAETCDSH